MSNTTKEVCPEGVGSLLSQKQRDSSSDDSNNEIFRGISPLVHVPSYTTKVVKREQIAELDPCLRPKPMLPDDSASAEPIRPTTSTGLSTATQSRLPNTPRTARRKLPIEFGDDMPVEGKKVRKSERLAKKRQAIKDQCDVEAKGPRLGDHSYTPVNVTNSILSDFTEVTGLESGPGFLDQRASTFRGVTPGFALADNRDNYVIDTDILSRQTLWQGAAHQQVATNASVVKAPGEPFQYTRMMWNTAFSTDIVDRAAFIKIDAISGGPDPKDLGSKIGGIVPFPRACNEQLATILNDQNTVYDITGFYTKCLFYSLLMAKMRDQGIPFGDPDLIQAPVTYVRVSQSPDEARLVIELIGQYVARGWYVFLEHHDFQRRFVLPLHLVALGGASMPPHVGDRSVAAQSIRWPAIRMLIICTANPPVFPVGALPTVDGLREFAIYQAETRGEMDLLQKAWYQASYLVSCEWVNRWPANGYDEEYWANHPNAPVPGVPLDFDDPNEFMPGNVADPDDPGLNVGQNQWFDGLNGEPNGNAQNDYLPLQWPNPQTDIDRRNNRDMAQWEARRAQWVQRVGDYRPPPGEVGGGPLPPRDPNDFPDPPPALRQAVPGTVRPPRRIGFNWFDANVPAHAPRDNDAAYPAEILGWNDMIGAAQRARWVRSARRKRAITPFFECNAILQMPNPVDYNCLWRWLGYRRNPGPSTILASSMALTSDMSVLQLVHLATWACAQISIGASTVLYDWNITGHVLQRVLCNVQVSEQCNQFLVRTPFLFRPGGSLMTEQPYFAFSIRQYIALIFGAQLPYDVFSSRDWACLRFKQGGEPGHWLPNIGFMIPPRLYHPLALSRWIMELPLEWGISGPGMVVDLEKDISTHTFNQQFRGWFAYLGSQDYTARIQAAAPYSLVTYGTHVANYILGAAGARDQPDLQRPQVVNFQAAMGNVCMPLAPPALPPPETWQGVPQLGVYTPLTQPTYNWDNDQVITPCFALGGDIPLAEVTALKYRKGMIADVGLEWFRSGLEDVPVFKPPAAPFQTLFAQFSKMARPDKAVSTPKPTKEKDFSTTQVQVEKAADVAKDRGPLPEVGLPSTSAQEGGPLPPPQSG